MWRSNVFCFVVSLVVFTYQVSGTLNILHGPWISGYYPWQQANNNRTELMCPEYCKNDNLTEKEKMFCCKCYSKPIWKCSPQWPYRGVGIEYSSRIGRGSAVYTDNNSHLNISKLFHIQEFLSSIPENICDFSDLVEIDFSWNRISVLENIKCLKRLDTLILKNNLITFLRNDTIHGMTELRVLDLSNNLITKIEPYAISDLSIGVLHMIFKNNSLQNIDITNIILEHSFCTADFSNNDLKEIVNEVGWVANISKDYGLGGFVDFSHNFNLSFPIFEDLGIRDLTFLGKVVFYGFDFRNTNITCDCKVQPFLKMAEDFIQKIWRDYFNVTCSNPPHLRDQAVFELVKKKELDKFTCSIDRWQNCTKRCICFHQPSQKRVVVNCSNTHQTILPDVLPSVPINQSLYLDFSNNNITVFNTTKYLSDTIFLNLDNNDLSTIYDKSLRDSIGITNLLLRNNTRLHHLPKTLQLLNPCHIFFGDLYLKCSCEILWIAKWASTSKSKPCSGNNNFYCRKDDGHMLPSSIWTKENLQCSNESWKTMEVAIVFGISSFVIGITALLIYHYKYEIYLLSRRDSKDDFSENEYFKFDIYISFNDNNDPLFSWVCNELEPVLNDSGYSLCLPSRDFTPGSAKSDAILEHLHKSKKFLFLVDDKFLDSENVSIWSLQEWRHSWNIFYSKKNRNIAVVNYDQLRTKDIDQRQIRAFFRLGLAVDFSNRKLRIFDEIFERLKLERISYESDAKESIIYPNVINCDPLRDVHFIDCRRYDTPNQKFQWRVVHDKTDPCNNIIDISRRNTSNQKIKPIDDKDSICNLDAKNIFSIRNNFTASQFFDTQEKKYRQTQTSDISRHAPAEQKYKPAKFLHCAKIHPYEPQQPRYKIPEPIFKSAAQ